MAKRRGAGLTKRPTGIAFFDFDNTLIDADAGPLFGRYLLRARVRQIRAQDKRIRRILQLLVLRGRYLLFGAWMSLAAALYKTRALRRSQLVRAAYRGLRGVPAQGFARLLRTFVRHRLPPLIYPAMVQEIKRHQEAGRRCVVITTGMEVLVQEALQHFPSGVELIGCELLEKEGKLTGKVQGPLYGVDKANIMRAYSTALGIDLAACWAYSDHWSDVEMLEAVSNPVCVNPRGRLHRVARKRGWHILRPAVAQ